MRKFLTFPAQSRGRGLGSHGVDGEAAAGLEPGQPGQARQHFQVPVEIGSGSFRGALDARARQITLLLARQEQEVTIAVEDDGRGFEPGAWWKSSHDHFGLSIMHARAARIGAKLQVDSAPGQGTRVALILPLDGAEHGHSLQSGVALRQPPLAQGMES